MNSKRQAILICILVIGLIISGCASGQLIGQKSTPTADPSLCPQVYLQKALSGLTLDTQPNITTKLNDDKSVESQAQVIQGNLLAIIYVNVSQDTPSIPSSLPGATLQNDAPKIGDASALFDIGNGMFQYQFVHHNVNVTVSFGFIDIFGSRNVDVVMNLAKSIDQALPTTELPVQASCVTP